MIRVGNYCLQLDYWTYFLALLTEKLQGYNAVFTREEVKSADPFDDKFEKFCAENGLGDDDEDDEEEFNDAEFPKDLIFLNKSECAQQALV